MSAEAKATGTTVEVLKITKIFTSLDDADDLAIRFALDPEAPTPPYPSNVASDSADFCVHITVGQRSIFLRSIIGTLRASPLPSA